MSTIQELGAFLARESNAAAPLAAMPKAASNGGLTAEQSPG